MIFKDTEMTAFHLKPDSVIAQIATQISQVGFECSNPIITKENTTSSN